VGRSLSLTTGRVCLLHLLPALASLNILGSESRGTRDHTLLSQIRDSLNLKGQVPVFISPRNRMVELYLLITLRHGKHTKHRFQKFHCCVTQSSHEPFREHVFPVSPLVRVMRLLPSNGCCLQSHYLATSLHATKYFIFYRDT
jgi:hypothetical protein